MHLPFPLRNQCLIFILVLPDSFLLLLHSSSSIRNQNHYLDLEKQVLPRPNRNRRPQNQHLQILPQILPHQFHHAIHNLQQSLHQTFHDPNQSLLPPPNHTPSHT
jgi:hypothetical protein